MGVNRPLLGHAELDFGGTTLMLSDEYPEMDILGPRPDAPTCVSLHLHVDDADAVIARAVALGATLERAAQDAFYGERSGVVRDPFGHRQGVPSFISPPRKPAARRSARRPECRIARLRKRRATPQCAALQAFPSGWPRHAAPALSHGLPIAGYWLRRASRIHPHAGASAGVK
jgi:hypothetical protein